MKIAFVANTSWNIYNFRAGLLHYFLDKGHEIFVLAPKDNHTEQLKEWKINYIEITLENKGKNPLSDIKFLQQLQKIYKKINPDVVLHFTIKPNIYGTLACKRLKIPCINNVSGLGTTFIHKGFSSRIAHFLYKLSFRFAGKVFFQNNEDLRVFLDKNLVKEEITDLLPGSGINLEKFKPSLSEKSNNFTFLMIARLIYDKGVREYVQAAKIVKKKYPQTIFQLLGSYEKDNKNPLNITEKEVKTWKNDIEYLGTASDVRVWIAKTHVVVLPSYREGTPRSLLEAAAMGLPLLATDVAGCKEVVRHQENGLLCKAKDAEDLAAKMIEMIEMDANTLQKMGNASRKLAENFFDEKIVWKRYEEAIERILGKKL
jgi:glycosyltransferase involved in cell wall biosynthesis